MVALLAVLLTGLLLLAGCGSDGEEEADAGRTEPAAMDGQAGTGVAKDRGRDEPARQAPADGTIVTLGGSEFGDMLFAADRQAIYVFENDRKGESVCYGECAEAWPPVLTDGPPVARDGVRASLLGTTKRRGGRRQVTYAGKPLYFYAHESPGEVRCHDVDLNGGYWWVVGPDGRRRP